MQEFVRKSPFMDYRNTVPFIDLSGYIVKQPSLIEEVPAITLQQHLLKKRLSTMINLRRLQYRKRVEEYRNGLR